MILLEPQKERHKSYVKTIWKKLEKIGDIYLDTYKGWYSIRDESFIAENEITTNKNNEKVGPSGDILKWLEEPSYFLNYQNGKINYFNFIQTIQIS